MHGSAPLPGEAKPAFGHVGLYDKGQAQRIQVDALSRSEALFTSDNGDGCVSTVCASVCLSARFCFNVKLGYR